MPRLRRSSFLTTIAFLAAIAAAEAQDLGRYVQLEPMPTSNAEFGAAELGGLIYLVGGFAAEEALLIYDPKTQSWARGADLPQGVHHPAVAAFGDRIYVIGGHEAESMVQIYNPATDRWSRGADVPDPRRAMGIVVLDGRIHVMGGTDGPSGGGGLEAHGAYDPVEDSWEVLAPLLEPRDHGYAGAIDGKIYFASGRFNFFLQPDLQIYDPATDAWSFGPDLPEATSGHAVQVVDNHLFVIGGENVPSNSVTRANQRYNPFTETWERMLDLPRPLHAAANVAYKGSIYLFGGVHVVEGSSFGVTQVLRYDPPTIRNPSPKKLKAKILGPTSLRLKWRFKRARSDATSIEVQTRRGRAPWETLTTVAKRVRRIVVDGLEPGATYHFRVRARGPNGPSEWSNERTVTLPD